MPVLAFRALATLVIPSLASAHGGLTIPPPRNNYRNHNPFNLTKDTGQGAAGHAGGACAGDECLWFSEGCWTGCPTCSATMPKVGNYYGTPNCADFEPLEPTLPEAFRTWNIGNPSRKGDWTRWHPWRAPGRAPVLDPCGTAGGYSKPQGGGGETPAGAKQGALGSELPPLQGERTEWLAGDTVEVGWMVGANHGGGYLYSVCPKGTPLTEECLQAHPLPFVGANHTIRYLDGRGQRVIAARDVDEGTLPAGSAWRLNPIPACNCDKGFDCARNDTTSEGGARLAYADGEQPTPKGFDCPTGTQAPVPFDYGYGQQVWSLADPKAPDNALWVIVDRVRAPAAKGDYVLRWRWDAEQNPQVWTHCADISVV